MSRRSYAGCMLDLLLVIFLRVSVLAKLSAINCVEEFFFSFGVFKTDKPFLLFNSSKSVHSTAGTETVFIDG